MSSTKTNTVVEARRRAREAKAILDAQRAQHDQAVEEHTTAYYIAVSQVEELEAQVTATKVAADEAVRSLLSIGETADRVATLTGLSRRDVRRIKREAEQPDVAVVDESREPSAV